MIYRKSNTLSVSGVALDINASGLARFRLWGASTTLATLQANGYAVNDGTWHHMVGVVNRTTAVASLYVDGKLYDSQSSFSTENVNSTAAVRIGGSVLFVGSIDEMRVYNRALSTSEIYDLYSAGH